MKGKILVVDDDPTIRNLVTEILKNDGWEVCVAEDGRSALEFLESEQRPLSLTTIFLDVVMPGMNGLDVLTQLKLQADTQQIPVIMLTGESKAEDIMAGYSVGADYYITKPFTRQQLIYGLNLVLGESDA